MAGVRLDGVSRVFPGGVVALHEFDLEVTDEEFLVIVGPSGCGKSTTLRLIAGLEEVSAGEIRVGNRLVNDVPPKDRDIAMVFQNYALYPHMSVYRNMAFGLELRYGGGLLLRIARRLFNPSEARRLGAERRKIGARIKDAAGALGIAELLNRLPGQLSGGERQRVALGRALVREPAVFLFDEPLSNLDARLRVEMRRELKELHQKLKTTMIYVTHDQVEALTLGDRIVVLDQGVVQQVGEPLEVYDRPKSRFVAGFLGAPPMNFVRGQLVAGEGQLRFHGPTWSVPVDKEVSQRVQPYVGQPVELGIRPEDVCLRADQPARSERSGAVHARVSAVEPLGDSVVLRLDVCPADQGTEGSRRLPSGTASVEAASVGTVPAEVVCKVAGRTHISVGERIEIEFDAKRTHFFDVQSGLNVSLSS